MSRFTRFAFLSFLRTFGVLCWTDERLSALSAENRFVPHWLEKHALIIWLPLFVAIGLTLVTVTIVSLCSDCSNLQTLNAWETERETQKSSVKNPAVDLSLRTARDESVKV